MRNTLRSAWVGVLVSMMVIDPATACRYCGQSWGYYGPSSYSYESSSCCYSPCQSCGCEEVVVSEPCGCQSCGCEGQTMSSESTAPMSPPRMAPQPPAGHPTMTSPAPMTPVAPSKGATTNKMMPSTVNKPMETTPAPSLPPQIPTNAGMPSMGHEPSSPSMSKPAEKTMTPPQSTPAEDDLFGTPAKPSDTGNDLFGGATETKPAPSNAAPAAESNSLKMPAEPEVIPPAEKPGTPAADDLFGPSPSGPAAPSDIKLDAPKEPSMSAPAEGDKAAPDKDKDKKKDDDLFGGFGAILREPGGLASNELRRWVDNTGHFSCEGRLARVTDGQVQLLKDNGHTSTVPMGRLSQVDLAFVYRQASADRSQSAAQTAQYTPASLEQ